jgi:hypothetical protein
MGIQCSLFSSDMQGERPGIAASTAPSLASRRTEKQQSGQ